MGKSSILFPVFLRLGGTKKYYMGGQNADYYNEIVLFALDSRLVEIYILFREPVDEAILAELKGVIGNIQRFE